MITHCFNKDLQILEVEYKGTLNASEICDFLALVTKNNSLPKKLKMLINAKDVTYDFTLDSIDNLIKSTKQCSENFEFLKVAIVHNKPVETAFSHLLEIERTHPNHIHKVFYSEENALKWLLED